MEPNSRYFVSEPRYETSAERENSREGRGHYYIQTQIGKIQIKNEDNQHV